MGFRKVFHTSNILPESLLKRCYHHWKQSVQRIVSNHAVVPPGYDVDFIDLTEIMYNSMGSDAYGRAVQQIRDDFPNAKKCLKDELQAHPTRTTNGIEPFHRDLYRIVESKKPVIDTMYQIFVYLNSIELGFDHVKNGGRADDRRKKTSKPRETKKFVNDDRAPDTTKTLFDLGTEIVNI
ncbi:hypothetical protein INT45_000955 [Circinella minor]|uniref:Uncharacterized protein n=1 Tax=Circinella minor TaxID=1195481 RepID=A0A8H7VL21_9FUNG|nr:hypothetical protein INT45_000955 [Circinella minor]